MLAICTDDKEAEISGTADEFREVRLAIISLLSSTEPSATFAAAERDPAPYARALAELVIRRADGPTRVIVIQSGLEVIGSDDSLARFASWFNFPSSASSGYHSHFEPLPGDQYHSSQSIPLMIVVSDAAS